MFLITGNFYSMQRLLREDITHLNRLSRLGVIASPSSPPPSHVPPADATRKRPRPQEPTYDHSFPRPNPAASAQTLAVYELPAHQGLGSFGWAIKEDATFIKVLGFKYAKSPILEKLGMTETQIFLASYLSKKGSAACPCPTRVGHDAIDSPLHTFTEAALSLRPLFEDPPFRIRGAGGQLPPPAPRGRGTRRPSAWGRGGRQAALPVPQR